MSIKVVINFFLDAVYPPHCIVCQVVLMPDEVLCVRCAPTIRSVPPLRTHLSNKRALVVHAVSGYQPPLDRLIKAKEYRQQGAATLLGILLAQYLESKRSQYDLLVPVPQHWMRYAWRGYNQATLLARQVSKRVGIPVVQPFIRKRHTYKQRQLNKNQRISNVANVFGLKTGWQRRMRRLLAGKRFLLIDDVYTTGATMKAFAHQVWQCQPACVHALVACRVME